MQAVFKRVVLTDEWIRVNSSQITWTTRCIRWAFYYVLPPGPFESYEFTNYVLGFRFEPTERELNLIQTHELFGQTALTIREGEPSLTFADLLGPELVPEVNPSQAELLRIEGRVREASLCWTHFFDTMPGSD